MDKFTDRITAARERADQAKMIAKQREVERMQQAEKIKIEREAAEQTELLNLLDDIVCRLEGEAEKGYTKIKVDLPLKGHLKDFEYRPGCQPDFIFKKDSLTERFVLLLRDDLGLKVNPQVYKHIDVCAYDRDVTWKYWLEIKL
jgi:hypothetical protein